MRVLPKPEANDEVKWLESLESVLEFALRNQGPQRTARFLESLTERLREQGIEALILGGTELPLLLRDAIGIGMMLLDTARLHVEAAVGEFLA